MDKGQWAQVAYSLNSLGNYRGRTPFAAQQANTSSAMIQQAMIEKERKEREKKKKAALGGKVGSTLGTLAGLALAPVTGGSSMVLAGLGGMAGGTLGQAAAGGGASLPTSLSYGAQGALAGYGTGRGLKPLESIGLSNIVAGDKLKLGNTEEWYGRTYGYPSRNDY